MSFESLTYLFLKILLVIFFVISIYNLVELKVYNKDDAILRSVQAIGIGLVLFFIGCFVFYKCYYKKKLTKIQISFMEHCSPFLAITGLSTVAVYSKKLEDVNNNQNNN